MKNGTKLHNLPFVSIILPVKDGERYLNEALDSIITQTYTNWEMIIVDDGSRDKTPYILKEYKSRDKRVSIITNKRSMGISKALNKGVKKAHGSFLARMDADDISYPNRLERQAQFLLKHKEIIAIGTQCDIIDAEGRKTSVKKFPLSHEEIYNAVFRFNPLQHPTLMINRVLLPRKFIFYDILDGAEDLNLLFKLFLYGKVANMDQSLLAYRIHGENSSFKKIKHIYRQALEARIHGILRYGYRPSIISIFSTCIQTILVLILPEFILCQLYFYARGIKTSIKKEMTRAPFAKSLIR